ncbi:hypothetical protein [Micromonospora marina]
MVVSDQRNRRFTVPQHSAVAAGFVVGASALLVVAPEQVKAIPAPINCC